MQGFAFAESSLICFNHDERQIGWTFVTMTCFTHHDSHIAEVAIGNKNLGAINDIFITIKDCCSFYRLQIWACAWFRHGNRCHGVTRRHFRKPVLLLFCIAKIQNVVGDNVGMQGEASCRVHGIGLLFNQNHAVETIDSWTAIDFGHGGAE